MQNYSLLELRLILEPLEVIHFFHSFIILGSQGGFLKDVPSSMLLKKHPSTIDRYSRNIGKYNLWSINRTPFNDKVNNWIKHCNYIQFKLSDKNLNNLLSELFSLNCFLESMPEIDFNIDLFSKYILLLKNIYTENKNDQPYD